MSFLGVDFVFVADRVSHRIGLEKIRKELESVEENIPSAIVNAVTCLTPRVFYDSVLNALAGWCVEWEKGYNDSFDGFVHGLKEIAHRRKAARLVIVVECADRLRTTLPELVVPLTKLSELVRVPVTTVFISDVPWEDIRPSLGAAPEPFFVDVPILSKQATLERLKKSFLETSRSHPDNKAYHHALLTLYEHFADMLYSTCAPFIHDPDQLAYISAARWPGFVQPVLDDHERKRASSSSSADNAENMEITPPSEDTRVRLMRFFAPSFTSALEQLYPRLIDADAWASANAPVKDLLARNHASSVPAAGAGATIHPHTAKEEDDSPIHLPRLAKFILLAAYLASTNPAKSDVRMFSRAPDQRRRRRNASPRKSKSGQAKVPQRLLGPTPFPLDRLLAILGVLLREFDSDEEDTLPDPDVSRVHVYATVTELADMRLLYRTGVVGQLDSTTPSLRCGVSYEVTLGLARELGVPLNDLMWDPA